MNYGIKNCIASKSWVYEFMIRHGFVFRKVLFERRGKINEKQVDRYLTEITDAVILYGQDKWLNMDEIFICTWNPPNRVIGDKGKETIKVNIKNMNAKEGTTFIGTESMNPKIKIPLSLIAKGKTSKCEQKY